MVSLYSNRIWLIGGSEGIGLELVKQLLEEDTCLIVSARKAEENAALLALKEHYPISLHLLNCDVTDKKSLPHKVQQAWNFYHGLDTWIYNAGIYHPMDIKNWDIEAFERMNQVNYLGAVYLMTELLPYFQQQNQEQSAESSTSFSSQWLWNISLSSDFGLPYGGGYSAPKAALQNLAESIAPELALENLQLKVVNHGFVKTRLTAKNDFPMLGLMTPDIAAEKIIQALKKNAFETRFPLSLASLLGVIKRLPKSWAMAMTRKMLRPQKESPNKPQEVAQALSQDKA